MGKQDNGRYRIWFILFFSLLLLLIIGASLSLRILSDMVIDMGRSGFAKEAAWRSGAGVLASAAIVICLKGIVKRKQGLKGMIGRIFGIAACLLAIFFLIPPVILDLPYLDHPETTYLCRLSFDDDLTGDGPVRYDLRGVGIDGSIHSFSVNAQEYDEGQEQWLEDNELRAKITYLPHTDVVMSLDYLYILDEQAEELYPSSASLPDDWQSFAIQINDTVYSLPAPLDTFLKDGWMMSAEEAKLQLPGADEPYERYRSQDVRLSNAQGQRIDVTVYNTTEETIDIAQGTVGHLYVIYGNHDFAGTDLRIPGGLMLGWATREEVLARYGEPRDEAKDSLIYQADDLATERWRLSFDESGYLDEVMILAQEYHRND